MKCRNEASLIHVATRLVYDSRVRFGFATFLLSASLALAQEGEKPDGTKAEPPYTETFSGPVVELTSGKIVVSRSILGKPPEKRTLTIKTETRVEGKLRVRAKVTVGFVVTNDGEYIARLIVVRGPEKAPQDRFKK